MFCPKCGTKNSDDAAFCGSCGASLGVAPAPSPAAAGAAAVAKKPGSNKTKLIAAIVAVVVIVAIIVGVVVSCSGGGLGGKKELLAGTYKYGHADNSYTSYYLSMDIAEGNKVTFTKTATYRYSNDEKESISGVYEFTSSADGSNVYTVKDLKLPNGQSATSEDIADAFGGGLGSDRSDNTITIILPEGYENGNIEGRCGFVHSAKASDGQTYTVGGLTVINSDGTGARHNISDKGNPIDLLTDTSRTADNGYTCKITNDAPGRYTLIDDEYGSKMDITIPVKE